MASYNVTSSNSLDWDRVLIFVEAHLDNKTLIASTTEYNTALSANVLAFTTFLGLSLINIQLLYNFPDGISVLLPITELNL